MVLIMLILTIFLLFILGGLFLLDHKSARSHAVRSSQQKVKVHTVANMPQKSFTISSKDIAGVAGDDVLTVQLNLARAYLESGRKALAINMLKNIIVCGNIEQRTESERLLSTIEV